MFTSDLSLQAVLGATYLSHTIYPREYILHAQGINESDAHSENSFSLFSCVWTLA